MNNPSQNQLKNLLMKDIIEYVKKVWAKDHTVSGIKIVEEYTFSDSFPEAFYVKKEYGTELAESLVPHTYGILWSVDDLNVTIGENLDDAGKISLFSRTYSNNTDKVITVSEKLEEAIRTTDSTTIGFTEKINAGMETSVTAGVEVGVFNASATAKFSMDVELGSSQSSTKTLEQTTTAGFEMQFDVSPHTKKVVSITATRKVGRALQDATFVANGKVYVRVAYNSETLGDQTHIYVIETDDIKKAMDNDKVKFPLEYKVAYVVENVAHTNYNVEIKEVSLNGSKSATDDNVVCYPLETQTTAPFPTGNK